jgi:hypothetical protein
MAEKEVTTISDLLTNQAKAGLSKFINEATQFIENGGWIGSPVNNGNDNYIEIPDWFYVFISDSDYKELQPSPDNVGYIQGFKKCTAKLTVYLSDKDKKVYLRNNKHSIVSMIEEGIYDQNIEKYTNYVHQDFLRKIEELEYFKNNPEVKEDF